MRPNNLFRDHLEKLMKEPVKAKPEPLTLTEAMQRFADATGEAVSDIIGAFMKIAEAFSGADTQSNYTLSPPSLTEARSQALGLKQHQGHGPTPDPLRVRGRVTRYRERG